MGITIKQIADETGVSIATVSHALNKTRYVRPDLVQKIYEAAEENGYFEKHKKYSINTKNKVGKQSEIALIVPGVESAVVSRLITQMSHITRERGYLLSVYVTERACGQEIHILIELLSNRRIAGIVLIPEEEQGKIYKKLVKSGRPFVCLENVLHLPDTPIVMSDNKQGAELAVRHLLRNGHEKILMLLEDCPVYTKARQKEGYLSAYSDTEIKCNKGWMLELRANSEEAKVTDIKEAMEKYDPTAIFATGDSATSDCLKAIQSIGMECPKDISVVSLGTLEWSGSTNQPLTMLVQDIGKMTSKAMEVLFEWIESGKKERYPIAKIPMRLMVGKSTQLLAKGPNGERVVSPEDILLSKEEEDLIRRGNFTVGISLHYTGTEWTRLHEKAIRETLEDLGVRVLSVMDAHFNWKTQNMQLKSLMMQRPDAIIAVPTDEERTASTFRKLSKETKLIFINGLPNGFKKKDYNFWVSVNELENGGNAAKILGNYFEGSRGKIGMLIHGAPFFATRQRDYFAEEILKRYYPNIEIVEKLPFVREEDIQKVCEKMLSNHPDMKGIYVTWDRPALKVIELLKAKNRTDIVVVTTDLDYEIASYISRNEIVAGLSSQRPFEQGVAVAIATARSLLAKEAHGCIGVSPYMVLHKNLEKAWNEILKSRLPKF